MRKRILPMFRESTFCLNGKNCSFKRVHRYDNRRKLYYTICLSPDACNLKTEIPVKAVKGGSQ